MKYNYFFVIAFIIVIIFAAFMLFKILNGNLPNFWKWIILR